VSLIGFFHKMFDRDYERETIPVISASVFPPAPKIVPAIAKGYAKCSKCETIHKKEDLINHDDLNQKLCSNCSNLLKIYRGETK